MNKLLFLYMGVFYNSESKNIPAANTPSTAAKKTTPHQRKGAPAHKKGKNTVVSSVTKDPTIKTPQKIINELKEELRTLKDQCQHLEDLLNQTSAQNVQLNNQLSSYKSRLVKLERDLENYKGMVNNLEIMKDKLQKQIKENQNTIRKFTEQNATLQQRLTALTDYLSTLNEVLKIKQQECTGF